MAAATAAAAAAAAMGATIRNFIHPLSLPPHIFTAIIRAVEVMVVMVEMVEMVVL